MDCECDKCGKKFEAGQARSQKWMCGCPGGKIVSAWWGKPNGDTKVDTGRPEGEIKE